MKFQEIIKFHGFINTLTLSHLGVLIHSQPGGADSAPLCNFSSLHPNQTKFGVMIVRHKKKLN